jgi:hypothetical protein
MSRSIPRSFHSRWYRANHKVHETIALYSSPIQRLTQFGPIHSPELDAVSLVIGASDAILAGQLLAEFGSLACLARACKGSFDERGNKVR